MIKLLALISLLLTISQSAFAAEPTEAELLAQCDLNKNGQVDHNVRDPSQVRPAERAEILKEAACAHRLKMAALVKKIPDLIAQCDTNGNGEIDDASRYGVISRSEYKALKPELRDLVRKEWNCLMDKELAKGKEESAKLDKELAKGKEESAKLEEELAKLEEELAKTNKENDQLIEIFALLDAKEARNYLKNEIQKAEKVQAKAKLNGDQSRVKSIEYRLTQLRKRQEKLK